MFPCSNVGNSGVAAHVVQIDGRGGGGQVSDNL